MSLTPQQKAQAKQIAKQIAEVSSDIRGDFILQIAEYLEDDSSQYYTASILKTASRVYGIRNKDSRRLVDPPLSRF